MKTTFRKITTVGLIMFMAIFLQTHTAAAQHEQQNRNDHKGNHGKIEAQRIAFITQKLELTPDEAKVFWPVYDEYDAKRHELRKTFKASNDIHGAEIDKMSEKEASQMLDDQIIEAQKLLDLRKEYHAKFKSVLPAVKVLKLYDAEREFQKMLIDKLRQHNPPPHPKAN